MNQMNISLIAAMSLNRVIGLNNKIPWYLPNDLFWFKKNTLNKIIVMGRVTYESIGHPLNNRINIILSKRILKKNIMKNTILVNSLDSVLKIAKNTNEEIMVIGGSKMYELFFPYARRLYLTYVKLNICGDRYFPFFFLEKWKTIFFKYYKLDKKNIYDHYFKIMERI
ncbi:MAG: type 3 dihydrofolate reductase [Arsenophonus sp.]|nr:MAG: type 3 dihydrofolate reductase [Arsenophonus sp.]